MESLIIIVGIVGILVLIVIGIYNNLVTKKKKMERNSSLVDVYLKKRFDLIPNLVEVCKGYAKYEQDTLEKVIKLRSSFNDYPTDNDREELNKIYNSLIALVENYPEIKASDNYLKLQRELTNVENEIQASRRIYINSITEYNNLVMKFPSFLIAKIFGFKQVKFPTFEHDDVKIKFE